MAEDITRYKKSDGILQVIIDDEYQDLEVYEIIKEHTEFLINEEIYATLYNPININLSLIHYYESEPEEIEETNTLEDVGDIEEEEELSYVKEGVCELSIIDLSNNEIIDSATVHFYNGIIIQQMSSGLYLGDYILKANYLGDKYYEDTSIAIQFSVTKRDIKCIFDETYLFGYPNEDMSVDVTISDVLNGRKINNCLIDYSFNGMDYTAQTNEYGRATLNFTIPSTNKDNCMTTSTDTDNVDEQADNDTSVDFFLNDTYVTFNNNEREFNDNEEEIYNEESLDPEYTVDIVKNTEEDNDLEDNEIYYGRPEYELSVTVDNDTYEMKEDQMIKIYTQAYDTDITFYASSQNNDRTLHIEGNVIALNDQEIYNVRYGKIDFDITDIPPQPDKTVEVTDEGNFSFDITVVSSYNAGNPVLTDDEIKLYSSPKETITTLTNLGDSTVSRNYAEKHKVNFKTVTECNGDTIYHGMISFILMRNYNEIYRYVTEINKNGEAFFTFDISTVGEYQVVAQYHSIFEYNESESNILTYKVT